MAEYKLDSITTKILPREDTKALVVESRALVLGLRIGTEDTDLVVAQVLDPEMPVAVKPGEAHTFANAVTRLFARYLSIVARQDVLLRESVVYLNQVGYEQYQREALAGGELPQQTSVQY